MSNRLVFGCNTLAGTGKKGVLHPDKKGRYPLVLGAFNAKNFGGIKYLFNGAQKIMANPNSDLNRKIRKQQLYGEMGHPTKFGLSKGEFSDRWLTIMDNNAAWQIDQYILDADVTKNFTGEDIVTVTGFVVPWAPFDTRIRQSFESETMNTAASIRTVANQGLVGGVFMRDIINLITWDAVLEQGMPGADKHSTPACESFSNEAYYEEQGGFDGLQFTREFAEAYEHTLKLRSELCGENLDNEMAALDIIKVAGGWAKVPRMDMPALSW